MDAFLDKRTMALSTEDITLKIYDSIANRYREDYASAIEVFHKLESKAQGIVALSGILLTGLLAILSKSGIDLPGPVQGVLMLVVAFLAFSIISSVFVVRVRDIKTPPSASKLSVYVDENLPTEDLTNSDLRKFVKSQFNTWEGAIKDVVDNNNVKSRHLESSIELAICALLSLVLAVAWLIVVSGGDVK